MFKKIFIEITNHCNLHCSFCPGTVRKKTFIAKAEFQQIIDQIKNHTNEVVLHVLGEPLLHPDLLFFIDYALLNNLAVMITTNGTLLKDSLAEALSKKKLRQINISLHIMSELTDPENYLDQVTNFAKLSQKNNPDGYINLRLWNRNNSTQKNIKIENKIYLNLDNKFEWPDLKLPRIQENGFCYGLQTHCGILVDGTVVPCCLDGEGVIKLGNIFEQPFKDILKTARVKNMQKGFKQKILTEPLCQRCGYIKKFN